MAHEESFAESSEEGVWVQGGGVGDGYWSDQWTGWTGCWGLRVFFCYFSLMRENPKQPHILSNPSKLLRVQPEPDVPPPSPALRLAEPPLRQPLCERLLGGDMQATIKAPGTKPLVESGLIYLFSRSNRGRGMIFRMTL